MKIETFTYEQVDYRRNRLMRSLIKRASISVKPSRSVASSRWHFREARTARRYGT